MIFSRMSGVLSGAANAGRKRGELLLTEAEAELVNGLLEATSFRLLQLSATDDRRSKKAPKSAPSSEARKRRKPTVVREELLPEVVPPLPHQALRASRRRRDLLPGKWEDAATAVMDALLSMKAARHFFEPYVGEGVTQ